MFYKSVYLTFAVLVLTSGLDARKTSSGRSRGSSSRATSRRAQAAPPPAPKPEGSLFGWQTKAQETPIRSSVSHQSRASQQSHSYPSSNTGLSGNQQPPSYQQAVKQSQANPHDSRPQQAHTYPQNNANPAHSNPSPAHTYPQSPYNPAQAKPSPAHTYPQSNPNSAQNNPSNAHTYPQSNPPPANTQSHAYPASGGLSGHSGVGGSYPAQSGGGLSGASAPSYPGGQAARNPVSSAHPANNYQPPAQGPPPAYPGHHGGGYGSPGYGNPNYGHAGYGGGAYGGMGGYGGGGFGGPGGGGFGGPGYGGYNYGKYGGMSRGGTSTLAKVGIAGAGVGTLLTGLALWNLARSGHNRNTYIYQDHHGNPIPVPINETAGATDPILGELVNCTLTVNGANATEVIGIPCAIATSFSHDADLQKGVGTSSSAEEAKCIVTVVTKNGTELSTTIPCSILLNTAKEANVTEPPPLATNGTDVVPGMGVNGSESALPIPLAPYPGMESGTYPIGMNGSEPLMPPMSGAPLETVSRGEFAQHDPTFNASSLFLNPLEPAPPCKLSPDVAPDPINPCMPSSGDVSVIPLSPVNSTAQSAAAA